MSVALCFSCSFFCLPVLYLGLFAVMMLEFYEVQYNSQATNGLILSEYSNCYFCCFFCYHMLSIKKIIFMTIVTVIIFGCYFSILEV